MDGTYKIILLKSLEDRGMEHKTDDDERLDLCKKQLKKWGWWEDDETENVSCETSYQKMELLIMNEAPAKYLGEK